MRRSLMFKNRRVFKVDCHTGKKIHLRNLKHSKFNFPVIKQGGRLTLEEHHGVSNVVPHMASLSVKGMLPNQNEVYPSQPPHPLNYGQSKSGAGMQKKKKTYDLIMKTLK